MHLIYSIFCCSNFHFRLIHDLMIVLSSEYVVVESICSRCAPCLTRVSARSLPLRPQWAGMDCKVVVYLLDRSVSFVNRLCFSLSLELLIDWRTERASVRNTTLFWSSHFFQVPVSTNRSPCPTHNLIIGSACSISFILSSCHYYYFNNKQGKTFCSLLLLLLPRHRHLHHQ